MTNVTPDLVESIFSTPIVYYKYPDDKHKELKEAVRVAIQKVEPGYAEHTNSLVHFYQHNKQHLLYDNDDPIFQDFHDWLEDCYVHTVQKVQGWRIGEKAFITDCWVNITRDGGNQVMHNHANSFLSGTYYLQMPEGAGAIQFFNPSSMPNKPNFGFDNSIATPFNQAQYYGNCQEQYLLVWPSNIVHQTLPTTGDGVRTSISMNFLPKEFIAGAYNFKIIKHDYDDPDDYPRSTRL